MYNSEKISQQILNNYTLQVKDLVKLGLLSRKYKTILYYTLLLKTWFYFFWLLVIVAPFNDSNSTYVEENCYREYTVNLL